MTAALPLLAGSLTVAFVWGLTPVIQKHALTSLSATTVLVLVSTVSLMCLVPFAIYNRAAIARDVRANLTPSALAWLVFVAVVGGFLSNLLYIHLLKQHACFLLTAIVSSAPVVTLLLAVLALKEAITPLQAAGAALVVVGVAMTTWRAGASTK